MFNLILWGNYISSKIDESSNSNTTTIIAFKNSDWANVKLIDSYTNCIQHLAYTNTNELP